MSRIIAPALSACAATLALGVISPAWALHGAEGLQWGDAPPVLPHGAKLAVLHGNPMKPGPYVIRLSTPAGYKVPPHWHSQDENVTVISGTLKLGMGDTFDAKEAKALRPGDFYSIPAKAHHFATSKGPAVIQIHGEGPFDITYINPSDDPSKSAGK